MKRQCRAYVKKTQSQCQKKAMFGSLYCFWHQSWGVNVVGAIMMLILGAFLGPPAQTLWETLFPSTSSKLLHEIVFDKPYLKMFLNGVTVSTNIVIPIPQSGELEIIISNQGKEAADQLMVDFCAPSAWTNIVLNGSWQQQAPRIIEKQGTLQKNEDWLHWTVIANMAIPADGSKFITPPIQLPRNGQQRFLPVIVATSAKRAKREEFMVFLDMGTTRN